MHFLFSDKFDFNFISLVVVGKTETNVLVASCMFLKCCIHENTKQMLQSLYIVKTYKYSKIQKNVVICYLFCAKKTQSFLTEMYICTS